MSRGQRYTALIGEAVTRGLERQEIHGDHVLRAALKICDAMTTAGYDAVADEIKLAVGRRVFTEFEVHEGGMP